MKGDVQQRAGQQLSDEITRAVGAHADGKREAVFKEIEQTFGMVPGFYKGLPAQTLEQDWKIMRELELSDRTAIPPKYKELIGLAVAAATHCRYCSKFHSEGAELNGASMEEINEALLLAKQTQGWSAYLNGLRYDVDTFDREVQQIRSNLEHKAATQRV